LLNFKIQKQKKRYLIDTSDKKVMKKFKDSILEKRENLYQLFSKNKSDKIILETDKSFVIPLNNFFKLREKSFR
jgi:hypothetical protein